jgi:hypothetical protein
MIARRIADTVVTADRCLLILHLDMSASFLEASSIRATSAVPATAQKRFLHLPV